MARRYGAINEFQSLMSRAAGFARPTRYQVMLTAPVPLGLPHHAREMSLLCDTIVMPGHDLQTHSAKYGTGIATEMVTGHGYEGTIEATFYCDVDMGIKTYFEKWQEQAISTTRNTVRYYKDNSGNYNYAGTMKIYQLGSHNEPKKTNVREQYGVHPLEESEQRADRMHYAAAKTYGMEVEEVYPTTIGQIEYAYATVDAVVLLPVSFQYRRWTEIDLAEE